MDHDKNILLSGTGSENDLHEPAKANVISNGSLQLEGLIQKMENALEVNSCLTSRSDLELSEQPTLPSEAQLQSTLEELFVKEHEDSKNMKPLKGKVKRSVSGRTAVSGASKSKDVKTCIASNGTTSSGPCARQTVALKTEITSLNEKQNVEKLPSGKNIRNNSKQAGLSDTSSPTGSKQIEENRENTKLKAPKNAPGESDKIKESPLNLTAGDFKPQKSGTLPTYSFNFKCDARAEKRREFNSKLEEKIHAKEVEECNLLAKTKETRDVEIKLWRKSLAFKATPMPSFYQEPPPSKAELKKIPTTRPKSPKLGRKKSGNAVYSEEGSGAPSDRLSLDEKISRHNVASTLISVKKPQRKSLPKLPFETSNLSSEKKRPTPHKIADEFQPNCQPVEKIEVASDARSQEIGAAVVSVKNPLDIDNDPSALKHESVIV